MNFPRSRFICILIAWRATQRGAIVIINLEDLPVPIAQRCMPRSDDNEQSAQDTRFKTLNRKLTRDPNLHEEYPKKVTVVVLPSYESLPLHCEHCFLLSLGISFENIRLDQFIRSVKTIITTMRL